MTDNNMTMTDMTVTVTVAVTVADTSGGPAQRRTTTRLRPSASHTLSRGRRVNWLLVAGGYVIYSSPRA